MLMEGTANKTPAELEEAIDLLGARISVYGGTENMTVSVNCLTRNFEKTLALVEEILLEPRWDAEQFELVKSRMAKQWTDEQKRKLATLEIINDNSNLVLPQIINIDTQLKEYGKIW